MYEIKERGAHARPEPTSLPHVEVDPALTPYQPAGRVSGVVRGVQSDTTPGLFERWIEGLRRHQPDIEISAPIGGSGAAGPALTDGIVDFGFIARELLPKEETPFVERFGYAPLRVSVSGGSHKSLAFTDALTFFVHPENPIDRLSFHQIDAIFSKTLHRGGPAIDTWGQLGVTGALADKPIKLYGVKEQNGFERFLAEHVLLDGQWRDGIEVRDTVFPLPGFVGADPAGISYSGFAFVDDGVKTLPVAVDDAGPYLRGTVDEVASQAYPLSRRIFVFANRPPGAPLDPALRELLRYALSREGQQAVVDDGIFLPLPAATVARELAWLD